MKGTLFLDEVDSLSPRGQVRCCVSCRTSATAPSAPPPTSTPTSASSRPPTRRWMIGRSGMSSAATCSTGCPFSASNCRRCGAGGTTSCPCAVSLRRRGPARPPTFTAAASGLLAYAWPGNVRELENAVVQRQPVRGPEIDVSHLRVPAVAVDGDAAATPDFSPGPSESMASAKRRVVDEFEKHYLLNLMWCHRGNVAQAAHSASKERRELGKLWKKAPHRPATLCRSAHCNSRQRQLGPPAAHEPGARPPSGSISTRRLPASPSLLRDPGNATFPRRTGCDPTHSAGFNSLRILQPLTTATPAHNLRPGRGCAWSLALSRRSRGRSVFARQRPRTHISARCGHWSCTTSASRTGWATSRPS